MRCGWLPSVAAVFWNNVSGLWQILLVGKLTGKKEREKERGTRQRMVDDKIKIERGFLQQLSMMIAV